MVEISRNALRKIIARKNKNKNYMIL